ncbi:MAG: hypothetical protein ACTSRP_25450 [Candidatus Helarchaeota archaeon]
MDPSKYRGFLIAGAVVGGEGGSLTVVGALYLFLARVFTNIGGSYYSSAFIIFRIIGLPFLIIGIISIVVAAILLIYGYHLYRIDRGYV